METMKPSSRTQVQLHLKRNTEPNLKCDSELRGSLKTNHIDVDNEKLGRSLARCHTVISAFRRVRQEAHCELSDQPGLLSKALPQNKSKS